MTKVAVIQAAAIPFEPMLSVEKAGQILERVSAAQAQLAVFPEAYLGGYPKGSHFGSVVGTRHNDGRKLYQRYVAGAVSLDGPELALLAQKVSETNVHVVMGIIEKLGRTLYCTAVTLAPNKGIVGIHRKLMPTGLERLIWGFGDGSTMQTVDTPMGRIGNVICWENYMPALRQAMYAQGTEIYCTPTADDRPTWLSSMVHIALEGRVFVLSACQAIKLHEYPDYFQAQFDLDNIGADDYLMRGGSCIISPYGEVLAGPVFDAETELYADIDLAMTQQTNLDFDATGHYSRPDIFNLHVNTSARNAVDFSADAVPQTADTTL
ncbi:carbon-nitrogen hydrolase family protein [Vitreoscilla massiliensis]|uniref:Carbon-nitrogen hydrolase family protein n=1 Tax=Vitreoscilla massiliensis TaxID=1689272 RepID=A0ABY4E416_9NEIS|nr:carbon-nitrogen hydrolase family protein [Vitreoscilla massiliensis]UOO90073.1 carbon-nitrogen hydrolase family protein [Vitreoscilla massiliensis]